MVKDYYKRKGMPKCGKGTLKKETYIKSNMRSSAKKSRIDTRQNSKNMKQRHG